MMDCQLEKSGYLTEYPFEEILNLTTTLMLELRESTYEHLKEAVHWLDESTKLILELRASTNKHQKEAVHLLDESTKLILELGESIKNEAEETLCFEDLKAENPYLIMGNRFDAPLCTHTGGYHSTRQCLKKCNTISVHSNMRDFCNSKGKIQKVNQRNSTGNEFLHGLNEPYPAVMLKTSQLQEVLNNNSEFLGPEKRKKTVHRVSSFVIAATVYLWIFMDICSHLPFIQLQPKSRPIFFWSTFLKLFGFMAYVSATAAMIVVRAPFSGMQSFMLMFWAILMFVSSAKSLTEVYLLSLGIILTGCYVLVPKKPPHSHKGQKS